MKAVISLGLCFANLVLASDTPIFQYHEGVLDSKILGEERQYFVHLPASYDDKKIAPKNYPVLFILDGNSHFSPASGMVDYMASIKGDNLQVPEMIVVGVSNAENRRRDLAHTKSFTDWNHQESSLFTTGGGGGAFLEFIKKELLPTIERNYRAHTIYLIAGQSLGGQFTLNAFMAEPELFQCYIAMDSSLWWDEGAINEEIGPFLSSHTDVKAKVYISLAGHSSIGKWRDFGMTAENMKFAETLQKHAGPGIDVKFQIFPDEDHNSLYLLSLHYGLKHCFDGYKPEMVETFLQGAESVTAHFEKFSKAFGAEFLPPEDWINRSAWAAQTDFFNAPDIALDLLKLNVKNYPKSSYAHSRLAEFYKQTGEESLSRKFYKKALTLDPGNKDAEEGLVALGG